MWKKYNSTTLVMKILILINKIIKRWKSPKMSPRLQSKLKMNLIYKNLNSASKKKTILSLLVSKRWLRSMTISMMSQDHWYSQTSTACDTGCDDCMLFDIINKHRKIKKRSIIHHPRLFPLFMNAGLTFIFGIFIL